MKEYKSVSSGGIGFLRKIPYEYGGIQYEADVKTGDIVTILDAGVVEKKISKYTGKEIEDHIYKIKTKNGEKRTPLNQDTRNVLVDEFGEDSENWIGKNVNVIIFKTIIAGNKRDILYLVTPEWKLDEYGKLTREGGPKVDTIEYPSEEIDPKDIPF